MLHNNTTQERPSDLKTRLEVISFIVFIAGQLVHLAKEVELLFS